jgi:protein phosphatase
MKIDGLVDPVIYSWCRTDTGLRRDSNQDSYLIDEDLGLYVVADGMGGHSGGEVASKLAVESVADVLRMAGSTLTPREQMVLAYTEASRRIFDKAAYERPEFVGMGTTMVTVLWRGGSFYIGNVGDSRVYLFRKPLIWQLTEDHSLINEQLRSGLITEEQHKTISGRNVITRSVGYEREVSVDVLERPVTKGDVFLLCSDGLSGLVSDARIAEILATNPLEVAASKCVDQALANGGDDNVTVMIVAVGG